MQINKTISWEDRASRGQRSRQGERKFMVAYILAVGSEASKNGYFHVAAEELPIIVILHSVENNAL